MNSATEANTSAGDAKTSSTNVSNRATAANTSAGDAKTSATNAPNSASSGSISVGVAKSYAAAASDRAITSIAQQRLIPVLEMLKHLPLMQPIVLHERAYVYEMQRVMLLQPVIDL